MAGTRHVDSLSQNDTCKRHASARKYHFQFQIPRRVVAQPNNQHTLANTIAVIFETSLALLIAYPPPFFRRILIVTVDKVLCNMTMLFKKLEIRLYSTSLFCLVVYLSFNALRSTVGQIYFLFIP